MSNVGKTIYGYCGGFFRRDSYGDKIIVGEGENWIVVKENIAGVDILQLGAFSNEKIKNRFIKEWENDEEI